MTKRITIVGGSGFVGRSIVKQAVAAGYQVTVACRHPERARALLVHGVQLVAVDIMNGRGLDAAVAGADSVINLVGLLFERGRYTFAATHVQGTEHLLAACQRQQVRQYLHMSALGAGRVPASLYAQSKAEAETRVRQSSLAWTIFQPSIIYGAGDDFFNKFRKLASMLPVLPVVAAGTRFQPIWVEDVAHAFVASIGNRHVASQTYELAGKRIYSMQAMMQLLLDQLDPKQCKPHLLSVPTPFAKLLATLSALLPTPIITADQLTLLQHDNIAKGEPYPQFFGTTAELEAILPTYIQGDQAARLQHRFDAARSQRGIR